LVDVKHSIDCAILISIIKPERRVLNTTSAFTAFRPFLGPCCVRGASAQLGGPKVGRVCRAVPT
jgi:hypothetical protein